MKLLEKYWMIILIVIVIVAPPVFWGWQGLIVSIIAAFFVCAIVWFLAKSLMEILK